MKQVQGAFLTQENDYKNYNQMKSRLTGHIK